MARIVDKKILLVMDIWIAYTKHLMAKNNALVTKYSKRFACPNYTIGTIRSDGVYVELMNYSRFRKMLEYYFDKAKKEIIKGNTINIMSKVGKICAKRVERDFRKDRQKKIDWARTKQQPKIVDPVTGKISYERVIYFVTDDWCRIAWVKTGKLKNETVYEFKPAARNSAGTSGFKLEFSEALRADPLLKYQYLFTPLILRQ